MRHPKALFGTAHLVASRAAFDEAVPNDTLQNGLRLEAGEKPFGGLHRGGQAKKNVASPGFFLTCALHFHPCPRACSPPRRPRANGRLPAPPASAPPLPPASCSSPHASISSTTATGLLLRPVVGLQLRPTCPASAPGSSPAASLLLRCAAPRQDKAGRERPIG